MLISLSQINNTVNSLESEDTAELSNEALEDTITRLENYIADGSWNKASYASTDIKMMPAPVNQANNKYPGMNLTFVENICEISITIKSILDQGIEPSRFIANTGEGGIHFSVIDHRRIDNKTSLILFEPASLNSDGPALLAFRAKSAIKQAQLSDCYFSVVEIDIQRSSSESAIFSLALVKKISANLIN